MEFRLNDFFPSSRNTLDFIKYGSGLYLLGLLVMFLYLVQLHVLSEDLIRPQAVIIGVYVWLLADTIPKCLLLLLQLFSLKPWLSNS
jgi:uncharacterized membrane protein (GlpM family)